jgi:O-antigen ligase
MIIYKKIIIKKKVFDIPIFLFLLSQILSTIFSIDRHTSIFGYYGRFNGGLLSIISYIVLYYGFVSNINVEMTRRVVPTLLKTSLLSSLFVILWGLPGKFGYDLTCYLFTGVLNNNCWTDQFKPAERMFSTLGQPNWLGAFLAVNFFIGLYFFFKSRNDSSSRLYRILYFLYLLLNFSAILFTRSRSALLAIVVGLSLFLIYFFFRRDAKFCVSTLIKRYIILILLLLIPIILFKTGVSTIDKFLDPNFYLTKSSISNLQSLRRFSRSPIKSIGPNNSPISLPALLRKALQAGNNQSLISTTGITESGDIRKIVWQGAINLGLKYPLFGSGVETFAYSYYFVRPKEHNLTSEWDFIYNKAHNEYLNYFATTGFIGLVAYLIVIGSVVFIVIRKILNIKYQISNTHSKNQKYKKNSNGAMEQCNTQITNYQLLITCLFLTYLTILITNFFGFSTTTINLYFYLIPAFLILISQKQSTINNQQSTLSLSLFQKLQLIVPFLICLIGLTFPITYFVADINYALADNYQKIQEYPQAYLYLTKALSYKNEHVYEDKLSSVLANLAFMTHYEKSKNKEVDQLIELSKIYNLKSLNSSPKNVLYWKTQAKNYYLFYQIKPREEDFKKAIEALDVAKTLSPTDPKIYYSQAMLYLGWLSQKFEKIAADKALLVINKSIQLKSNFRDGYYGKALILKQLERKQEAKNTLQYILEKVDPNDEEVKKEIQSL